MDFELVAEQPVEEPVPKGRYPLSARHGPTDVEAFRLDRHLVTVERYRKFIDAGGYREKQYWHPRGWRMITTYKMTAPRFWNEEKWARFLRNDRPVVGVSWYEADAFCRWAGRRLPTDIEWEAAARGFEGRIHPWGDEWDPRAARVRGQGARVTWPIGQFRRGVGPFGHYDLVGNVWQWTSTPSVPNDPDSPMMTRGGSWASRPDQNRTDVWNAYDPSGQHSHVGFRTARP
jgi:formylglycine-generating enzyme required for sulfatase activity